MTKSGVQMAEELCEVQPMPHDLFSNVKDQSLSVKELKEQGFRPVSQLGLLWIKDDNSD